MKQAPHISAGAIVDARAQRWTVDRVTHEPPCTTVDLTCLDPDPAWPHLTLVAPFDEIRVRTAASGARHVSSSAAFAWLQETFAVMAQWPAPLAARDATMDLHPHQLTTCMALRGGRARRVLVADAVGSGKTVQAGLAIAQLIADTPAARVLIVVPAGLKAQWTGELRERFRIHARVVETAAPAGDGTFTESPWAAEGATLASLDYVKRADVLPGLEGAWWHLLVVDEAHHAAGATDRGHAVRALAARALKVVLLTATPHDGDPARFRSLCTMGALEPPDPLLMLWRRPEGDNASRASSPARRRRIHWRWARPLPEEQHMHLLLDRYAGALASPRSDLRADHADLILSILRKRAASSPFALMRTALRRRALLGEEEGPRQASLEFGEPAPPQPVDEEEGPGDAILGLPVLEDSRRERAWLGALAESARRACAHTDKALALQRLIRRVSPIVVFTEYRDTLAWLHARFRRLPGVDVVHGNQGAAERERALRAFARGDLDVLLATDAAAEGLNLHQSCRAAVLFDLPWTPTRVEQRIGRIDRIGQSRPVHVWMLVSGSGSDAEIVARLEGRQAAIDAAIGGEATSSSIVLETSVSNAEREACAWLSQCRAWSVSAARTRLADRARRRGRGNPDSRLLVATLPERRAHALQLRDDALLVVARATWTAGGERLLERAAVAVHVELRGGTGRECALDRVDAGVDEAIRPLLEARRAQLAAALEAASRRDRAAVVSVLRAIDVSITRHFRQRSLFEPVAPTPPDRTRAPALAASTPQVAVGPMLVLRRRRR